VKIVTMAEVDAARIKLTEVINDLRKMQGESYLPRLYAEVAAFKGFCEDEVVRLLREYHEQRSPESLLKMLRHTWECALILDITWPSCAMCEAGRLLSKEAA
jgi:hypothetical protein